ncbi:MAG: tyrosine/phenylalanine carboxypeptidase domain-containing protein [Polyangiaceae bacterium]
MTTPTLRRVDEPALSPILRLIVRASREVKILVALTPANARGERARLTREFGAGRRPTPRWTYEPWRCDRDGELRRALEAAERALGRRASTPIEAVCLARVRELLVEAALCAAVGTLAVERLARARFRPADTRIDRAASALCASWLREAPPAVATALIASESADPRALLSRMREAVRLQKLPFEVVVSPTLAPLAATGDTAIFVASGRQLTEEDANRTVLHEVEGHARPRAVARRAQSALFRAGTARGIDDQEGRALLLEERASLLGPRRRRQLAARHRAVESMLEGASFAEVAGAMIRECGLDAADAVVVAERAFRGSDGTHPGLGRERVYLEALVRVRAHLAAHPDDEHVLASGQVSIESVDALRSSAPRQKFDPL